ncbi:hypothetical protein DRO61_07435 [Candidatus Bathyarchaeota archaeon]|jgi:hypothetical protein|nr:MAG: hypothetical protein DRO61_07435 [Candidatus Bathyarchaeota archaeon]
MENKIYYFEKIKPENSDILLAIVKEKALENGIKHIVVASTRGATGVKAAKVFKDSEINVVVVTHQIGPKGPELTKDNEKMIKDLGAQIVTCTHAFGGVGSSLRRFPPRDKMSEPFWPAYVPPTGDLIANVLRLFSQGMKVCFEITLMAADAGIIPVGENVIAVGGQGRGADTAIVIKSANTTRFFDLDVQEIISKTITKRLARP